MARSIAVKSESKKKNSPGTNSESLEGSVPIHIIVVYYRIRNPVYMYVHMNMFVYVCVCMIGEGGWGGGGGGVVMEEESPT